MRLALWMLVGLCLVAAAPVEGGDDQRLAEPPIKRARKLLEAGDRAGAANVLEDALIDGPAADRTAIVKLLGRCYREMCREAEAAGKAAQAAHYRDNLAILERIPAGQDEAPRADASRRDATTPPAPGVPARRDLSPPAADTGPRPSRSGPTDAKSFPAPAAAAGRGGPAASPATAGPALEPSLTEPMALPEPPRLPTPGPAPRPPAATTTAASETAPEAASAAPRDSAVPDATPEPSEALANPGTAAPEMAVNPGAGAGDGGPVTSAASPASPASMAPPAERRTNAGARPAGRVPPARTPAAVQAPGGLNEADHLFEAQQFDAAGRIYAALAARNLLPADRRPHWAYCRYEAVVRRINARPRSSREWDEIEKEVRNIARLAPGLWYGDYLLGKVTEARRSRRRSLGEDRSVIRGLAPDDPSPTAPPARPARRQLFGPSRGSDAAPPAASSPAESAAAAPSLEPPASPAASNEGPRVDPALAAALAPAIGPEAAADGAPSPAAQGAPSPAADGAPSPAAAETAVAGTPSGQPDRAAGGESATTGIRWEVHETPSFRIYHCDRDLAERAGAVAEAVRTAQGKRWGSSMTKTPWSPRCELYLYPTAHAYAESTGQPELSPGLSTMSTNGVRVLSRRMSLRVDNPRLLSSTLPHEVTHIVLADLFVARSIPRWADEGIAVLAEPAGEQHLREADLQGPLDARRVFEVGQLMTMDYPDPQDWRLFYAQSVSLTRFLVEQGPPARFIQFVRDAQRVGPEAALRDAYQIDGLSDLQDRWVAYARQHIAADVAARNEPASGSPNVSR